MARVSVATNSERRGRDAEAAVRPLLHQAHVHLARRLHHAAHGEGRPPRAERMLNAMTVDVEDYFHVSVFDGVVPRDRWSSLESRVCANTERMLAIFDEHDEQLKTIMLTPGSCSSHATAWA